MYIDPFVAGVGATLLVELGLLIGAVVWRYVKTKGKNRHG